MVWWLALSLVPRQLWLALVAVLALQLAGINVLGPVYTMLIDPVIAWLGDQLTVSWSLW